MSDENRDPLPEDFRERKTVTLPDGTVRTTAWHPGLGIREVKDTLGLARRYWFIYPNHDHDHYSRLMDAMNHNHIDFFIEADPPKLEQSIYGREGRTEVYLFDYAQNLNLPPAPSEALVRLTYDNLGIFTQALLIPEFVSTPQIPKFVSLPESLDILLNYIRSFPDDLDEIRKSSAYFLDISTQPPQGLLDQISVNELVNSVYTDEEKKIEALGLLESISFGDIVASIRAQNPTDMTMRDCIDTAIFAFVESKPLNTNLFLVQPTKTGFEWQIISKEYAQYGISSETILEEGTTNYGGTVSAQNAKFTIDLDQAIQRFSVVCDVDFGLKRWRAEFGNSIPHRQITESINDLKKDFAGVKAAVAARLTTVR